MGATESHRTRAAFAAALLGAIMATSGCADFVYTVAQSQDTGIINPDTPEGERHGPRYFNPRFLPKVASNPIHPDQEAERFLRCSHSSADNVERSSVDKPKLRSDECMTDRVSQPTASANKGDHGTAESVLPCPPGRRRDSSNPTTDELRCLSDLRTARYAAWSDITDGDAARVYLIAAMTLSDRECLDWFDRLNLADTTLHQTGDAISSFGSLTTVVLGATRASGAAIAATAGLFGFGKQSVDNLERNYVVAADLSAVKYAVQAYRGRYRQEIDAARGPWNYYSADSVLKSYHDTCNALSVRRFIAKRIDAQDTSGVQSLVDAAEAKLVADTKDLVAKPGVLTVALLPTLYADQFLGDVPADVKATLHKQLTDAMGLPETSAIFDSGNRAAFQKTATHYGVDERLSSEAAHLVSVMRTDQANQTASEQRQKDALTAKLDEIRQLLTDDPTNRAALTEDDVVKMYVVAVIRPKSNIISKIVDQSPRFSGQEAKWKDADIGRANQAFANLLSDAKLDGYVKTKAQALIDKNFPPPAVAESVARKGKAGSAPKTTTPSKPDPASVRHAPLDPQSWAIPTAADGRALNIPPPVNAPS